MRYTTNTTRIKTQLTLPMVLNGVITRSIMRATTRMGSQTTHLARNPYYNYPSKTALPIAYKHTCPMKIKGKTEQKLLGPQIASDDTGKHTQGFELTCDKDDCEKLKCPNPCGVPIAVRITFHATHKPIAGKFSAHVSDLDANGQPKSQYITRGYKKMSPSEYQARVNDGTFVKDAKFDALMQQHLDKFS